MALQKAARGGDIAHEMYRQVCSQYGCDHDAGMDANALMQIYAAQGRENEDTLSGDYHTTLSEPAQQECVWQAVREKVEQIDGGACESNLDCASQICVPKHTIIWM